VVEFKYLGTTLMNQNSTEDEIKSRLKKWNVLFYVLLLRKCVLYYCHWV